MARIDTSQTAPGTGLPRDDLAEVMQFGANPGGLRMFYHLPAGLAPGAPLVVVLHGCGQSAQDLAVGAGWVALADAWGFALVCPQQQRANNPNLCFNWFQPGDTRRDQGEVASIRQMVRHALAARPLDPGRVFATGLSAGGAMTAALLATYPEVFAAGAVIAGLPYGVAGSLAEAFAVMSQNGVYAPGELGARVRAACAHAGAWPRLAIWHGDSDAVVRPGAADDLARQWAELHRAAPAAQVALPGRRHLVWRDAGGLAVVELHRIQGMAHGAPIQTRGPEAAGRPGPFTLDIGVSSSHGAARFWGIAPRHAAAVA